MTNSVPLQLDDATFERLRALSAAQDLEVADLVRSALLDYLDRAEALAEDAARWEGYAESGGLDHDVEGPRFERRGARRKEVAAAIAGPFGDPREADDDTSRTAAERAFRELAERG